MGFFNLEYFDGTSYETHKVGKPDVVYVVPFDNRKSEPYEDRSVVAPFDNRHSE
jgi:hypothetical protein